ncbi:MAG: hypothetical protein K6E95_07830, partial [Lachnospiraceae bacterium]|nr:hypothetical protein [Lachnospiraceae bacterium]
MRTKKFKTIISILLSMALIVSTLAAMPADKAQATYMPIKTYEGLKLDMTEFLPNSLSNVPISTVLSKITNENGETVTASGSAVAYKFSYEGNYHVIKSDDATIDFSGGYSNFLNYGSAIPSKMEIICGKLDQLNLSNVRYLIDEVSYTSPIVDISYKDAEGKALYPEKQMRYMRINGIDQINLLCYFDPEVMKENDEVTYTITSPFKNDECTVKSIEGNFYYEDQIPAGLENHTDELFGNGKTCKIGLPYYEQPKWTLCFTKGKQEYLCSIRIQTFVDDPDIEVPQDMYIVDGEGTKIFCSTTDTEIVDYDSEVIIEKTRAVYNSYNGNDKEVRYIFKPDVEYSAIKKEVDAAKWAKEAIKKTVVGEYKNIADAESEEDITQTLLAGNGYEIDENTTFTFFYNSGYVRIISIEINKKESIEHPLDFEINRIFNENTSAYNTFAINGSMDSYYDDGYRGILISRNMYDQNLDKYVEAPMASGSAIKLRPSYFMPDGAGIYISSDTGELKPQESGVSLIDYDPDKTVHYVVTLGDEQQDYYYDIVGQKSGSELFTIAEEDTQGNKSRNILLIGNDYHDVFFANVGDTDIEGLTVELKDAKNVKLDEYWTIGETGKLAKFVKIPTYDHQYSGYVGDCIGKIRLLPDENDEGAISGTLVIKYKGSSGETKETRINLKGFSATPSITTTQLPKAKVGVPYSATIKNNMPELEGTSVNYKISGVRLPKNIEMTPEGELRFTPTASDYEEYLKGGSYFIDVQMQYTRRLNSLSYSTYYETKTLTLDLEKEQETTNTDPEPSQNDSTYTEPSNDDNTSSGYSDNTST